MSDLNILNISEIFCGDRSASFWVLQRPWCCSNRCHCWPSFASPKTTFSQAKGKFPSFLLMDWYINSSPQTEDDFPSGVKVTPKTRYLALNSPAELSQLLDTVHYMHYALAAYGWPMFIFQNKAMPVCKAVFKLTKSLTCCCLPCCTSKLDGGAEPVSDNCCSCNLAALQQVLSQTACDLVYASFHVDVGETPFFIGVDYQKKVVVISIRGTLSMKVMMLIVCQLMQLHSAGYHDGPAGGVRGVAGQTGRGGVEGPQGRVDQASYLQLHSPAWL